MYDDSRRPFILPDSVQKRRLGLIEGAMTAPPPHQWAEHLELLAADGRLTSVDDMLALMQNELDRLQEQIDSDEEPDRYSETVLAAVTAEMFDERIGPKQRESRREAYFAILLGYLYGRLTKPGKRAISESAAVHIRDYQAQIKRRQGGRSSAEIKRAETALRMAKAKRIWDELLASGRPERGLASIVAKRMNLTAKTIREWRNAGWSNETNE